MTCNNLYSKATCGNNPLYENEMCPDNLADPGTNIKYFSPNGLIGNSGSSFASPLPLTTAGLLMVPVGGQAWLLEGVYSQSAEVGISRSVFIYGGFKSTDSLRSDRGIVVNRSLTTLNSTSTNRFFSTTGSFNGTVLIDGMTMMNGKPATLSGGAINESATRIGNLTIKNCNFVNNTDGAVNGGAIASAANVGVSRTLTVCDCSFTGNKGLLAGGAIYGSRLSSFQCYNVSFDNNTANSASSVANDDDSGGAIGLSDCGKVDIINNTFYKNQVLQRGLGGAVYFGNNITTNVVLLNALILNSTFVQNSIGSSSTNRGGAVGVSYRNANTATLDIRNSIFWNNTSLRSGAGLDVGTFGTLVATTVCSYMASSSDGLSFVSGGTQTLQNRIGANIVGGVNPLFIDESVGNLRLSSKSIAIDSGNNNYLLYDDCSLLSPSLGININVDLDLHTRIVNNIVDLGAYEYQIQWTFDNNAQVGAPFCVSTTQDKFLDGDRTLQITDECVVLLQDFLETTNIESVNSFSSSQAEASVTNHLFLPNNMCPPEAEPMSTGVIYVSDSGNPLSSGEDWSNPTNLTHAIVLATTSKIGEEIWLKKGTYFIGGLISITIPVAIYGGFEGYEYSRSQRGIVVDRTKTVLDGMNLNRMFQISGNGTFIFDGMTMTKSVTSTDTTGSVITDNVSTRSGSLIIRNCNILSNTNNGIQRTAIVVSGDSLHRNKTVTVCDCLFSKNTSNPTSSNAAGTVFLGNIDRFQCYNVDFSENTNNSTIGAVSGGGAITLFDSNFCNLVNTKFWKNTTQSFQGGGIFVKGCPDVLCLQCSFAQNVSRQGGGIYCESSTIAIRNCIFWSNIASTAGKDLFVAVSGTATVCKYIASSTDALSFVTSGGTISLSGRIGLDGGIDPKFINLASGDLRLDVDSPAINRGDNDSLMYDTCSSSLLSIDLLGLDINVDLDQLSRIVDNTVDLGCYESRWINCIPGVVVVGNEKPGTRTRLEDELCPSSYPASGTRIVYVSVVAKGSTGADWDNTITLNTALSTLVTGDELWLQQGVYVPTVVAGFSSVSSKNFSMFGGFVGTETMRSQRDSNPYTNCTVLDGITTSNLITVTNATTNTFVIDGFTLTRSTKALNVTNAQFLMRNCIVTKNASTTTGEIVVINNNSSSMRTATICESTIEDNVPYVHIVNANVQIFNSSFIGNKNNTMVGSCILYFEDCFDCLMINSVFYNNLGQFGGSVNIQPRFNTKVSILQCTFVNNRATSDGGAVYLFQPTTFMNVRNCIFWNNVAVRGLDMFMDLASSTDFVNVCNYMASSTDALSFVSNPINKFTTSMRVGSPSGQDPLFVNQANGNLRLSKFSLARDSGDNSAQTDRDCSSIVTDPLPFGVVMNVDRDRFPRITNDPSILPYVIDLGAYEWPPNDVWQFYTCPTGPTLQNNLCIESKQQLGRIWYVNSTTTNTNVLQGTLWSNAVTLQTAVSNAAAGHEIWLQQGTYTPIALSLSTMQAGVRIYGGFVGTETLRWQRSNDPKLTSINLSLASGFTINLPTTPVATIFSTISLINSTTTAISAVNISSPMTIQNCIFSSNAGSINFTESSSGSPLVSIVICDSLFNLNVGILINVLRVSCATYHCKFDNNTLASLNGGIFAYGCQFAFVNCSVFNNTSVSNGILFFQQLAANSYITQCSFVSNFIGFFTTITVQLSTLNVHNSIFWNNTNTSMGSNGIDMISSDSSVLVCNYIASNTNAISFTTLGAGSFVLTNRIGNNVPGEDPLFVDLSNGNLRLTEASPARDAGDNNGLIYIDCPSLISNGLDINVDLDYTERIYNGTVDLGAYEWKPTVDCFETLLCWNGQGQQPCVHPDTLVCEKTKGVTEIKNIVKGDWLFSSLTNTFVQIINNVCIHSKGNTFVYFAPNALQPNVPSQDLLIRRGHPIFLVDLQKEVECQDCILPHVDSIRYVERPDVDQVYTLVTRNDEFVDMHNVFVKTWSAEKFAIYEKEHFIGKKLFLHKQ